MIEIARHYNKGPVKRKEISRNQNISSAYLENILISLKANKLIRTTRGANGGFALEKPPGSISLLQIVTFLEGTISPVECLENRSLCEKTGDCIARKVWEKLYNAQKDALKSVTLQDLLDMDSKGSAGDYAI
jgi:Rrf2 family protein